MKWMFALIVVVLVLALGGTTVYAAWGPGRSIGGDMDRGWPGMTMTPMGTPHMTPMMTPMTTCTPHMTPMMTPMMTPVGDPFDR
jgi:hypothetical protein